MDMNRRDDHIRRGKDAAFNRVSQSASSNPIARAKKRDSRADFFVQLARQFVDQVKSIARTESPNEKKEEKMDDDVILIDLKTSEPISKSRNGGLKVAERRVRIRGIPIRAASRVAEVLKNEFGIATFEDKRYREDGDKTRSLQNEDDGQRRMNRVSDLQDQPLHASSPIPTILTAAGCESSDDEIEIIEAENEPTCVEENGSEDRADRITDKNTANASKELAITQTEAEAPAETPCQSQSSSTTPVLAASINDSTAMQPPKTGATVVQCSPLHIAASQAVPAGTKPILRAQFLTVYQLAPVMPQTSDLRVVREFVKPPASQSSLLLPSLAPRILSSISRPSLEPESTKSESTRSINVSSSESDESATTSGLRISAVKNSVASLLAQRARTLSTEKSESSNMIDLSAEVVDNILLNSTSMSCFAISLMRHLFDKSELVSSQNVAGRTKYPTVDDLDEKRIDLIHGLLREKAGPNYCARLWTNCVVNMNAAIRSDYAMNHKILSLKRTISS